MTYLNTKRNTLYKYVMGIIFLLFSIVSLYIDKDNFSIFHYTSEAFTILISYTITIISINSYNISQNNYFTFLGVNFAFIATLNLLHVLIDTNIYLSIPNSEEISTLSWISAAYWQSISILVSSKYLNKKIEYKKLIFKSLFLMIFIIIAISHFKTITSAFIYQLEIFKFQVFSVYLISVISVISIYFIFKSKVLGYKFIIYSIICSIISQLFFLQYNYNYELSIIMGPLFKFVSFYFIYNALIKETLKNPIKAIFNDLKEKTIELEKINLELNIRNKELEDSKRRLKKSNEKYNQLLNFLPDAVILTDNEEISYVNNKSLELLNADAKEEILEKSIYTFIDKAYWDVVKKRINKDNNGHFLSPLEEKFITLDGKTIDVEVTTMGVCIDDKEYCLQIIRDITNKKKMEEMKLKLQENIQNDKIKNEFFANISHELRTPINVIYSALQLEDIFIDKNNLDKIKEYNDVIRQNCYRLIRLINNIIDITKIDSGFLRGNFCCINIVYVVENIVMSIIPYVKNKNMHIIFDTDIEEQYIECDLDFIERIILNLISNSIKYGKESGTIYVNIYNKDSNYINISVKDDGIGIPKGKQEDVFNRFAQVDKTLNRRSEGSGIGLSLVKSLVEMQSGNVTLASEEGVGTEIVVSFPTTSFDEVAATCATEDISDTNSIVKKINIEFSDIYL